MPLTSDTVTRILMEVTSGKVPAHRDTPEMAATRKKLQAEVDEIKRKGGIVDIQSEWS